MEKIKLGIIGTGSVVREIYQYLYFRSRYSEIVSVQAACDVNVENLEWFAGTWCIKAVYTDYKEMIDKENLDAVAVNTPDSLHLDPVLYALNNGLDVLLPKPTSDNVADVHSMIETAKNAGRYVGVDFHKRQDPVVKEARARYRAGEYGVFQASTWYMLDRLLVADPNHEPRFFATSDFAAKNSPVSFLTSHMADTFFTITGLRPVSVKANGYRHKLPSLSPIPVDGYDLVDTEVITEDGGTTHILTGWALPNPASCLTMQSGRLICSEGMIDLWNEWYGYREITEGGIEARNVLFRNFEEDGTVSGYGMSCPGTILDTIRRHLSGLLGAAQMEESFTPEVFGFFTTLVCECALESLEKGRKMPGNEPSTGAVIGEPIDTGRFLREKLGDAASQYRGNTG